MVSTHLLFPLLRGDSGQKKKKKKEVRLMLLSSDEISTADPESFLHPSMQGGLDGTVKNATWRTAENSPFRFTRVSVINA